MRKHNIITVIIGLVVAATLVGIYEVFFKAKFEAYDEAETQLQTMQGRLSDLQREFKGYKPQQYLAVVKGRVQPFEEAAREREAYFNMHDMWVSQSVPDDKLTMIKFYYADQYKQKYNSLVTEALRSVPPCYLPANLFTSFFQVESPDALTTAAVNKDDVKEWLTRINFGCQVVRMLIRAKAIEITGMVIWPPRTEYGVLQMHTVGLAFRMRMENLVPFLENLKKMDRYFNVNAIRIQNSNLLSRVYGPPFVQVEMLLTMARRVSPKPGGAGGTVTAGLTSPGTGGSPMSSFGGFNAFGAGTTTSTAAATSATSSESSSSWWQKLWPF